MFYLVFVLLSSHRRLVCLRLIATFGLSSDYYDVMSFVIFLQRFICVGMIQTKKTDFISLRYQITIVSILKN